ncbi:MAG: GNAT family N-acetyltransferase [Candidatus Thiodiazotropha sp.]
MSALRIELLAEHPQAISPLAILFESEWAPYYGEAGPGDAESDLRASANRHELPIALVAIDDDIICGTAALKQTSVSNFEEYSPWLAALVVAESYRGRGIGEQLVISVEALAKRLGYGQIYVGTGEKSGLSESLLQRRNWRFVDKSAYFVSEVRVYAKKL